jgi:VanZ family protein
MLADLRKPFFFVAIALIALALLVELGSHWLVGVSDPTGTASTLDVPHPGYGIRSLALIDVLVVFSVGLMGISLILPERLHGRLQGLATFVVAILVLLAALMQIYLGIALASVMVTLLLSPIFGTAAYFVGFSQFDRSGAALTLSLLMMLKLGFAVFLVLAHQRFLENKGLVLIIATTLLAGLLIAFLHAFVPGFLVSITDTVGAIVVGVLALVWAAVFLVGSLVSIVKVVV